MNLELFTEARNHGTILPKGQILVRKPVKVIRSDNGHHYQLALKSLGKEPVIRCTETGKMWHLTWAEMLSMAISSGITVPHPDPDPTEEEPE